jgi:hypothetical protein
MKLLPSILVTFSLIAVSAYAMPVTGPSQITASTSLVSIDSFFVINKIVDGVDLNTDMTPYNGFASAAKTGSITLTLNNFYNLNQFFLANDINVFQEGIAGFDLDFYSGSTLITNVSGFTASQGIVSAQTFNFPTVSGVNKVILNITSSPDRIEIREVAFNAVPEPTSSLLGLVGVLGLAIRRRR